MFQICLFVLVSQWSYYDFIFFSDPGLLYWDTTHPWTPGSHIRYRGELVHCKCPCPCPGHLRQQSCSTVKHFPFCRKQPPKEFSFSCLLLQPLQGPHKSLQQCLSPWPNDSGHYCCLPLRPNPPRLRFNFLETITFYLVMLSFVFPQGHRIVLLLPAVIVVWSSTLSAAFPEWFWWGAALLWVLEMFPKLVSSGWLKCVSELLA